MASKGNYISYAKEVSYEPQSIYLESGQEERIIEELRSLGTRRILVMRDNSIASYRNIEEFIGKLEKSGFRIFPFSRRKSCSSSDDINGALSVYREFNCDTIVVFGGSDDIFCAKMVSAMSVNNLKSPTEAAGYGKLKNDISVICCVCMDNSTSVSSNIAEFYDEPSGKWITVISNFLVPQIVVVDPDIAMRTVMRDSISSALDSLCLATECVIAPQQALDPSHRACAFNSVATVAGNLLSMTQAPDDGYLRKMIASAGIYAGTAVRMTGLGYAHLIVHSLKSRYGVECGRLYAGILSAFLKTRLSFYEDQLFGLYDHLVKNDIRTMLPGKLNKLKPATDRDEGASAFIELLDSLRGAADPDRVPLPVISEKDMKSMADEIRTAGAEFGLDRFGPEDISAVISQL